MGIDGIMFLLAFPLMVGLIIWVFWGVAQDRKKGASYIDKALPYLSAKDTPVVVAAKRTSPWKLFTTGIIIILIAIGLKIIEPSPNVDAGGQIEGIGLGGIIIFYLGFRSRRSSKKLPEAVGVSK